jgi:hypothetical protein
MQFEDDNRYMPEKRMDALVEMWERLSHLPVLVGGHPFVLNSSLAYKTVQHYEADLNAFNLQSDIAGFQAPVVAGLMANAILKFRPVVPEMGWQERAGDGIANEVLAIYHGICACSNDDPPAGIRILSDIAGKPVFSAWLDKFIYLLRKRNYTAESLVLVFETLCMFAFPDTGAEMPD